MTASHTGDRCNTGRLSGQSEALHRTDDSVGGPDAERAGLLISIRPGYANAILNGQKKIELRRRPPKSHPPLAVIYGSGTDRSVLGTARIEAIHTATPAEIWLSFGAVAGVTQDEFDAYFVGCTEASALVLTSPERAPYPLALEDLRNLGLEPPQSWRYINDEQLHAILSPMHPQHQATWIPAARTSRLWSWAWKGVRPVTAFGLRCVSIGVRQHAPPADPISTSPLDQALPAPWCYSTPGPSRSRVWDEL